MLMNNSELTDYLNVITVPMVDLYLPKWPVYSTQVTMGEIPGELSFCITMRECMRKCPGCHSKDFLWWDGHAYEHRTVSTAYLVERAVEARRKGATAICIMGGDNNFGINPIPDLTLLIQILSPILPVGLYTSLNIQDSTNDRQRFEYFKTCTFLKWIKTGPYMKVCGGLNSHTTNQRFFERNGVNGKWYDCTYLFWSRED